MKTYRIFFSFLRGCEIHLCRVKHQHQKGPFEPRRIANPHVRRSGCRCVFRCVRASNLMPVLLFSNTCQHLRISRPSPRHDTWEFACRWLQAHGSFFAFLTRDTGEILPIRSSVAKLHVLEIALTILAIDWAKCEVLYPASYSVLIHTLIHIPYTSFVDTAGERSNVLLSPCLSYRGIEY